jgi:multidrug efflux pump subunit AcrA (membrane-fusion protein)
VTVTITTSTARDALVVPVGALLAQAPGQYVVEVTSPGSAGHWNTSRYIPVSLGIFDDADGLVQVTGALTPGERVVVAAS